MATVRELREALNDVSDDTIVLIAGPDGGLEVDAFGFGPGGGQ